MAVVGSRSFTDYPFLANYLDKVNEVDEIELIVSGGARGTDELAEQWAKDRSIPMKIFLPDWDRHGKAAGPIRNREIVGHSDVVIAFWDGVSKGTKHTIDRANESGVAVQIVYVGVT